MANPFYKDGRTSICIGCGKEFPLHVNHPKQKHCSMKCTLRTVNGKYITKEQLIEAISKTKYRKEAAALLGINPATVSNKLKKYGLSIPLNCYSYSGLNGAGYQVTYGSGLRKYRITHRIIAEKALGRPLKKGEVVHHINLNKADNRPSNLLICTGTYHRMLHYRMEQKYAELFLG